jgi:hypothetical protein
MTDTPADTRGAKDTAINRGEALRPNVAPQGRHKGQPIPPPADNDQLALFLSHVHVSPFGCWVWQGKRNEAGYGRFTCGGKQRFAHRVAYTWLNGDIPSGLDLDHLCRNRACINPDHLDPVTHKENQYRSRKGKCPKGHPQRERKSGRGQWCPTCQKALNDTRRDAYTLLGLSQRQYLRQYGSSIHTARAIIAAHQTQQMGA